jgi:hypothetical protein
MKTVIRLFGIVHGVFGAVFALIAFLLLAVALRTLWQAVAGGLEESSAVTLIEAMGVMAVAVVALQIAQTIAEEEVIREMHISAPTRVRRFLSRFLVVLVVALAIEGLVATFKALHEDLAKLPYAAALIAAAGVLLAAWGVFIKLNRAAEELEPREMEEATQEDEKLK